MTEMEPKFCSLSLSAANGSEGEAAGKSDGLSSSENNMRNVLCYPCALRMSFLYHYPPPLTPFQVHEKLKSGDLCNTSSFSFDLPLVDDESHPRFFIIHETERSVRRCFDNTSSTNTLLRSPFIKAASSGDATEEESSAQVTWVCAACAGLYQFMDLVYAPLLAAAVRRTPFVDSKSISVNVSVHRSFTFIWLAASTKYFDKAPSCERSEAMLLKPPEESIIPEEWSNFKDFFVSDLRARVMAYLRQTHEDCLRCRGTEDIRGMGSYCGALGIKGEGSTINSEGGNLKDNHEDSELGQPIKKAKIELPNFPSLLKKPASCLASQAFLYSGENEGVVLEVNCLHRATEGVVTCSGLPAALCANRSECVLSYGVLYKYICPYLQKIGWGSLHTLRTEASFPTATSSKCRHMTAPTIEPAIMTCDLSHANIFLLGNYKKMTRSLSQSPWFSNGKRVGSFSLQEVIASPLLPFFFPEGVQPSVLSDKLLATVQANAEKYPNSGVSGSGSDLARKLTARSDAVHPSITAAENVYGFGRYKFHSAGREDVDVRMLGSGRPFVLEVISPSRELVSSDDLEMLTREINNAEQGCVEISHLRLTDSTVTQRLARHSESKVKRYRCVVWSSRSIPNISLDPFAQRVQSMKNVVIQQKTPLRVLHRRSLHARERTVHSMHFEPINDHWFVFDIETQAGTYIKEFIHGDLGRTLPNLGTLLQSRMDILQLDVVEMIVNDIDG